MISVLYWVVSFLTSISMACRQLAGHSCKTRNKLEVNEARILETEPSIFRSMDVRMVCTGMAGRAAAHSQQSLTNAKDWLGSQQLSKLTLEKGTATFSLVICFLKRVDTPLSCAHPLPESEQYHKAPGSLERWQGFKWYNALRRHGKNHVLSH